MLLQALVESPDHVCCRYRLRAFQQLLAQENHQLQFHSYPKSSWGSILPDESTHADVLILQRKLPSWWDRLRLRRTHLPILFDFDDAVWLRDSYSRKGFHSSKRLRRFRQLMNSICGVTAGNAFLAENAQKWNPSLRVHIIPTCIDVHRYSLAQHATTSTTLVWIGSASTLKGLNQIRPILEQVGRQFADIQLKLICDRFSRFDPLPVAESPWSEASETVDLASSDIGISWIPDDLWSRGKCGLKVLQYMAAGLPVIANPVGVHPEMILHGETGFLVNTPQEWLEAISILKQDPELRKRMGQAGRRRVEQKYSIEAGAKLWLGCLQDFQSQRVCA